MIGALLYHSEQSRSTMECLARGMSACGDLTYLAHVNDGAPKGADFVCLWGGNKSAVYHGKLPRLYLEAGYINGIGPDYIQNRLRFVSTEWNGLGGNGDELPRDSYSELRWENLRIEVKPWKLPGNNLLVLEQHPTDGAANPQLLSHAVKTQAHGFTVRHRKHPLVASQKPLDDDLEWADCAITYGSTAAVEAIIAGVPTCVLSDRNIASNLAASCLDNIDVVRVRGRMSWLFRLAYRQWTHRELETGEAWKHLRARGNVCTG